ncbi:FCS-Like Zinc finger 3-like [Zingiber officinale]|uniref:FLZ-type domain-containing protein n=1 Tax=Zingiber officinale TaxID=94328 RepID=A0A8J5HWI4_ZINOF|nr:FCS-Like Zinc finger 3-like [Zingiber officinale]KAG6521301.1 hypothetical protein ZIOFF_018416 [Zingiber officinale]
MRRTTSMIEFEADAVLEDVEILQPPPEEDYIDCVVLPPQERGESSPEAKYLAMQAHVGGRRWKNSADLPAVETAPFLAACGLCKRRIGPGRDTFMYRGDIAFCSLECRQQQITQDERKENCLVTSAMVKVMDISSVGTSGTEQSAGDGEMVAAA